MSLSVLVALLPLSASAASPVPDRPTRSRSARLVSSGSLETELGADFREEETAVPLRIKGSSGRLEPRVTLDLAPLGDGPPGLDLGSKLSVVEDRRVAVAGLLRSDVPLDGEEWTGELGGLLTFTSKQGLEVRTDVALALVGGGGIQSAGVPVSALVGWGLSPRWAGFADVGVTFEGGGTATAPVILGGGRWRPTDMLAGDLAVGWDAELGVPMASLGMAANFGRLRR